MQRAFDKCVYSDDDKKVDKLLITPYRKDPKTQKYDFHNSIKAKSFFEIINADESVYIHPDTLKELSVLRGFFEAEYYIYEDILFYKNKLLNINLPEKNKKSISKK